MVLIQKKGVNMINLSTPNKELLEELKSDFARADYWLTKKLGGEKKQRQEEHRLVNECIRKNKRFVTGDPVEYISPKGNRWYVWLKAERITDRMAHPSVQAFCYYETIGSIGAFVPFFGGDDEPEVNGCAIFTSHFFGRMSERLNIGVRSREMVKRFIEYIRFFYGDTKTGGCHAKKEIDVYLSGALGRGKCRTESGNIYEVNTFLPENMLNTSQREVYDRLRKVVDNYIDMSPVIMRRRLKEEDCYSILSDVERNCTLRGNHPDYMDKCMWTAGVIMTTSKNMNLTPQEGIISSWVRKHSKDYKFLCEFVSSDSWDINTDDIASMTYDCLTAVTKESIDKNELHKAVGLAIPYVTEVILSERDIRRKK